MENKNPQYFEGILQLRNPDKNVMMFVKEQIGHKKGVLISKTLKVRNGYDFYISSRKYLKTLGQKLKDNFGGELKISCRLHSRDRQTSKELYRLNVLYRCWGIRIGSIIEVRGEKIKVMGMGKRIQGKRLSDGKNRYINFKELA